jgi:hypothetical protein
MELAGLEPATSWVRLRADVGVLRGKGLPTRSGALSDLPASLRLVDQWETEMEGTLVRREHPRASDARALQSSQTMLMNRRPAAQLCVDSDPGGWVDVQRHRKPIDEQSPE